MSRLVAADQLHASPSQVSLLFTSDMAVIGVAMLITGWVSSRIGAKRTLLLGLVTIVVGSRTRVERELPQAMTPGYS